MIDYRTACGLVASIALLSPVADAAVISGTTVGLDGQSPQRGVEIQVIEVDANGDPGQLLQTVVSDQQGEYRIDVGNRPVVQLQFFNGRIPTLIEKLSGLRDITGLTVVTPVTLAHPGFRPYYFPCRSARPYASRPLQQTSPVKVTQQQQQQQQQQQPEFVTWTNKSGKTAIAKLSRVNGTKAYFERRDGKQGAVTILELTVADQQRIYNWQKSNRIATAAK